jgi:hypothetical protein
MANHSYFVRLLSCYLCSYTFGQIGREKDFLARYKVSKEWGQPLTGDKKATESDRD